MKTKFSHLLLLFISVLSIFNTAKTQGVNTRDSLALVDLYNNTNGTAWIYNTNWLTAFPVSTWYGVTVGETGVTGISLALNNLTGSIPTSFGNLENLNSLNLANNWLTGNIPSELGQLQKLTDLNLSHNKLSGKIPAELGSLINLQVLSLSWNQLNEGIPFELGKLANLTTLSLNQNQLTGYISSELGNLQALTGLHLDFNTLSGNIPAELGNLFNLQYLSLSNNQISGTIPAELGKLKNLEHLSLYKNQLNGEIPIELGSLENLWWLDLSNNQLTGGIPSQLGNLKRLIELELSFNNLTGNIPPGLGNVDSLAFIKLNNNQLNGDIPPEIANIDFLEVLNLSYNQLSGSIPPQFGNSPRLEYLYLANNQLSGVIPPELGNIHAEDGEVWLDFSNNQLSGSIPPEIGNIKADYNVWLNFSYNQITGIIPDKLGEFTKLRLLYLDHNRLTGNIPASLADIVYLNYLNLSDNQLSGSIPPAFTHASFYYTLDISNNNFTFDGMELIATMFTNAVYAPQANLPLQQDDGALSVSAGGTLGNNTYNWYKVGDTGGTTISGDSVFYPSQSGQYYAAVTNTICTQLTLYTDTVYYDATLPVNMISLKAQAQNNLITISWISLTEINVHHYEIQRSADSRNFTGIGLLPASGNGTAQLQYSFNDVKPVKGDNFYRIKATDNDGSIAYSNTVLVNMPGERNITLIYPNPAKTVLNVQLNGSASFSLTDQNGKILLTRTITNSASIDVSKFAAGLYYLRNNNRGEVQKVVVVK